MRLSKSPNQLGLDRRSDVDSLTMQQLVESIPLRSRRRARSSEGRPFERRLPSEPDEDEDEDMKTTTVVLAQPTATFVTPSTVQFAASSTSEPTIAVTVVPTMEEIEMSRQGGLSAGTQHALIAAGSIGGTIVVIFLGWLIWRMQRGFGLPDAFSTKRWSRHPHSVKEITPPWARWSAADRKVPFDAESNHSRTLVNLGGLPAKPSASLSRRGSSASHLPLLRNQPSPPAASNDCDCCQNLSGNQVCTCDACHDGLEGAGTSVNQPRTANWPINPPPAASVAPSSSLLRSEAAPAPSRPSRPSHTHMSSQSSLPSYLRGAQNLPPRRQPKDPNAQSRFSWTNSQAPRTPGADQSHFSIATSARSSVARFRTVESWVGNQAGRIDEDRVQDHFKQTVPVPDVPEQYKHRTNASEATIFNVHPGNEVVIPRRSRIPSEILDKRVYTEVNDKL